MSEDSHDNAVMVQGDIGETMRAEEEEKESEKERIEQGEGNEEMQTDEELKERLISRQEEKGKGEISAATSKEDIIDSELPPASKQRMKKKSKVVKQKEPNLYNLSKQLERHTKQLSNIESTVQQFPKYLKNTVIQSNILKQLSTSINQLQKQVGQIQKSLEKKSKQK
jgi:hypothetical protein